MSGFRIDPGDPRPCCVAGGFADDLGDAIQIAFPLETADARVIWCGTSLPLSYKYDVSVIMEDVIGMLEWCHGRNAGRLQVNFGSDTFNADWALQLGTDSVVVTAQWNSVVGDCEKRLNESPLVMIGRSDFSDDWLRVVRRAVDGVDAARIRLADSSLLVRARRLLGQHGSTASH